MTQILRRLSFAALIAGMVTCSLESAVAQTNDKTEPWEAEWKLDRMTDAKTFVLSTDVRTEAGHYYQITWKCEPYTIVMTLMAFTKNKEPRRVTPDFRATRRIQIRIDRHPALGVDFRLSEYYNGLQAYLSHHQLWSEEVRQQLLGSKSILIGNVFPDEIFEVKTGFDQATTDACNQSSAPKTKSEETLLGKEFLLELRDAAKAGEEFLEFLKRPVFKALIEKAVGHKLKDLLSSMGNAEKPQLIENRFVLFAGCMPGACTVAGALIVVDTYAGGVYVITAPRSRISDKPFVEHSIPPSPATAAAVALRVNKWKLEYVGKERPATGCLKADDKTAITIEGVLTTSPSITLPNGREYSGYIVRLPDPICATDVFMGGDSLRRVSDIKEVQLTFDSGLKISHLMGKRVVVTGTAFGQHTAYHIAPLILSVKVIAEKRQ